MYIASIDIAFKKTHFSGNVRNCSSKILRFLLKLNIIFCTGPKNENISVSISIEESINQLNVHYYDLFWSLKPSNFFRVSELQHVFEADIDKGNKGDCECKKKIFALVLNHVTISFLFLHILFLPHTLVCLKHTAYWFSFANVINFYFEVKMTTKIRFYVSTQFAEKEKRRGPDKSYFSC